MKFYIESGFAVRIDLTRLTNENTTKHYTVDSPSFTGYEHHGSPMASAITTIIKNMWFRLDVTKQLLLWVTPQGRTEENLACRVFFFLEPKPRHTAPTLNVLHGGQHVWAMFTSTLLASSAGYWTHNPELDRPMCYQGQSLNRLTSHSVHHKQDYRLTSKLPPHQPLNSVQSLVDPRDLERKFPQSTRQVGGVWL